MLLTGCQSQSGPYTPPVFEHDAQPIGYRATDNGPYIPGPGDWATDPVNDPAYRTREMNRPSQSDQQIDARLVQQAEQAHQATKASATAP
jgi:hypothetical protein